LIAADVLGDPDIKIAPWSNWKQPRPPAEVHSRLW
jgi:hypothetical protein